MVTLSTRSPQRFTRGHISYLVAILTIRSLDYKTTHAPSIFLRKRMRHDTKEVRP